MSLILDWHARQCGRKDPYNTRTAARDAARRRSKAVGIPLYVYKCPACGKYHMTKSKGK